MFREFDILFCAIAFICGFLLLIGKGGILMKDRNAEKRDKMFDMKKVEKASGIALMAAGVLTVIDMFTEAMAFQIGYVIAVTILFVGLFIYIQRCCKK